MGLLSSDDRRQELLHCDPQVIYSLSLWGKSLHAGWCIMPYRTLIRMLVIGLLGLGSWQTAFAQSDDPLEGFDTLVRNTAIRAADVIETAGYPEPAAVIRRTCSVPTFVNCLIDLSVYGGTILIFREHEVVGTFYTTIGEDEIARDYQHCEEDPGIIGASSDLGSIHCTEQLLTDPLWVGMRAVILNLADAAETVGYTTSARAMREACEYPGEVSNQIMTCALSPYTLLLDITPRSGDPVAAPGCTSSGVMSGCSVLRPGQIDSLADLGLGQLDQTGDNSFSATDLALLSGLGGALTDLLDGLFGVLAGQPPESPALAVLPIIAAGPQIQQGSPIADDLYTFMQSLAAMSSVESATSTPRRAARLSP